NTAVLLFLHNRDNMPHTKVHTHKVNIDDFTEYVKIVFGKWSLTAFDTSVIVKTVYPAKCRFGEPDICLYVFFVGHVCDTGYNFVIRKFSTDLIGCFFDRFFVIFYQYLSGTSGSELTGSSQTYSHRRSRTDIRVSLHFLSG